MLAGCSILQFNEYLRSLLSLPLICYKELLVLHVSKFWRKHYLMVSENVYLIYSAVVYKTLEEKCDVIKKVHFARNKVSQGSQQG